MLLWKAPSPFICLIFIAFTFVGFVNAELSEAGTDVSKTWCIARPVPDEGKLQKDIGMLCRELNCSIIMPGGSCYIPITVPDHASVLFNLYYKKHGAERDACDFDGDAMVVTSNPSIGVCIYP